MIEGTLPVFTFLVCKIVTNPVLEKRKLSIRNKHCRFSHCLFMANIEELDTGAFSRQTFKCQLNVRKAFKLDLQTKARFQPGFNLSLASCLHFFLQSSELAEQRTSMCSAVAIWHTSLTTALRR